MNFNARYSNADMLSQTFQGKRWILGYTQIIDKPNYLINKSKSCIILIFWTHQNVISNYGVDASLFDKYSHNMVYGHNITYRQSS